MTTVFCCFYNARPLRSVLIGLIGILFAVCMEIPASGQESQLIIQDFSITAPTDLKPIVSLNKFSKPVASSDSRLLSDEPLSSGKTALPSAKAPTARDVVFTEADFNYENATLSEDVTWRGIVIIRGFLVVAPQATLRIEPGTTVSFMESAAQQQAPRLVVLGRLQCAGTAEKEIRFISNYSGSSTANWGGILLLSSEKRNQFELCRIEGAEIAIAAHFSALSAKGVSVIRSTTGILCRDCVASFSNLSVSNCETGLDIQDSELDLRDGNLTGNRRGLRAQRSSLAISQVTIKASREEGILADECRIKLTNSELSANAVGAKVKGGEGQIFLSRFSRNTQTGLHLSGARVKVQRCLFTENSDGMQMDDGRGVVLFSNFSNNDGYNLVNNGQENISAVQNWWGSSNEKAILAKLRNDRRDARFGQIEIAPWLPEKPVGP